jgi:glutaredoxin-like protein NrdH
METDTRIKMYTLSTCGHCRAAKAFLNEIGAKYDYTDVDLLEGEERQNAIRELRKINQRLTFPTIVIGDTVIVGNNPDAIKRALGLS